MAGEVQLPSMNVIGSGEKQSDGASKFLLTRERREVKNPFRDAGLSGRLSMKKGRYRISAAAKGIKLQEISFWFQLKTENGKTFYSSKVFPIQQDHVWKIFTYEFEVPEDAPQSTVSVLLRAAIGNRDAGGFLKDVKLESLPAGKIKEESLKIHHTLKVRKNDVFFARVKYLAPERKDSVEFGAIGFDRSGRETERHARIYRPIPGDKLDNRVFTLEIRNPKTVEVKMFTRIPPGSAAQVKEAELKRLSPALAQLYSVSANRQLWRERTRGTNLVAGKKLSFSPSTKSYPLTWKGNTDSTDLTDGQFARDDDMIWFDSRAVSWSDRRMNLSIMADLGEVQPVEKAVIRICGGRINPKYGISMLPPVLEAWVSKDGRHYYLARRLTKVQESEQADADWNTLYYLPEIVSNTGPTYVYPFELKIHADARYVVIRSPKQYHMTTDEVAIIQAEKKDGNYNQVYESAPEMLFHSTAFLKTAYDKFYVPSNIHLPNWLILDDRRTDKRGKLTYSIDLPEQIVCIPDSSSYPAFTRKLIRVEKKGERQIYHFLFDAPPEKQQYYLRSGLGPFYFRAEGKIPAGGMYVKLITQVDGKILHTSQFPLAVLEIPKAKYPQKLSTGIGWFDNRYIANWPEQFKSLKHIGINTVSLFPLMKDASRCSEYLENSRKHHFKLRSQISPSSFIRQLAAAQRAEAEIACQIQQKANSPAARKNFICPAYRGKYYLEAIRRIEEQQNVYQSDYVTFDDEAWYYSGAPDVFTACSRCNALRQNKNMSWKQYVAWVQADFLSGFYKAVKKANPSSMVGFYAVQPFNRVGSEIFGSVSMNGFEELFPRFCDEVQPSNYSTNTEKIHHQTRAVFKAVKDPRRINRWLSAGTGAYGAETYGAAAEHQLVESLMNGCSGMQYYQMNSLTSPLDYYYIARALQMLNVHEDILMNGTLDEQFVGSNPNLLYTARTFGKKTLFLAGNYHAHQQASTVIPVNKAVVTDLKTGKQYRAAEQLTLSVEPRSYILLLLDRSK